MKNKEFPFSPEYDTSPKTESEPYPNVNDRPFLEIDTDKYEEGKPIRIIIRAKITHD